MLRRGGSEVSKFLSSILLLMGVASVLPRSSASAAELLVAGLIPWAPIQLREAQPIPTTPLLIEVADTAFLFPMAWFGERSTAYSPPWRFRGFRLEASLPPLQALGALEGHLDTGARLPGRGVFLGITVTALPPRPSETFDAEHRRRVAMALWSRRGGDMASHLNLEGLAPATEGSFGLRSLNLTWPRQPTAAPGTAEASRPVTAIPGDDWFVGEDSGRITTFISCQPVLTPAQQARAGQIQACDHLFHWNGMQVTLRYHRSLLPDWTGMERRASELLEHFRQQAADALARGARPGPQ